MLVQLTDFAGFLQKNKKSGELFPVIIAPKQEKLEQKK
jgi:hypothetical protein